MIEIDKIHETVYLMEAKRILSKDLSIFFHLES